MKQYVLDLGVLTIPLAFVWGLIVYDVVLSNIRSQNGDSGIPNENFSEGYDSLGDIYGVVGAKDAGKI